MPETYVRIVLTARPRKLQSAINNINVSVDTGKGGGIPWLTVKAVRVDMALAYAFLVLAVIDSFIRVFK